jgi:hypothetical protein
MDKTYEKCYFDPVIALLLEEQQKQKKSKKSKKKPEKPEIVENSYFIKHD